jgi:hypothetical protein
MLIEELIRLGRPLLEGDLEPKEVLRLITDVESERVKNFYRHVFVVEVPQGQTGQADALPMQEFGEIGPDRNFVVNQAQALGAPIVLPSGGNPLAPSGRYGPPVYPCYHAHIEEFRESAERVFAFLSGRLKRTPRFAVSDELLEIVSQELHARVLATNFGDEKKILGVVILVRYDPDGFFELAEGPRPDRVGHSRTGRLIVPNYARILAAAWDAKIEEGREAGSRAGPCTFSGTEGEVVSAYCKSWPWAFPTWTCPLPHGGDERMLVEGIGLAPDTYKSLALGACIFNKLTHRVSSLVLPELFSPTETRTGKEQAQRRKLSDLPGVYGSAFLLPIHECALDNADLRYELVRGIRGMVNASPHDATWADRYMTAVTGFDVVLPPDMATDDYRLTLVYFSGNYTRGDIYLRAYIEDVSPSTLSRLRDLGRSEARVALALMRVVQPLLSEKQQAYFARCYESVPYLLARAYGGAYLWQLLQRVFHRQSLGTQRVIANTARRLHSLVPQWPQSRWAVADEIGFYLSVLNFVNRVNRELANHEGGLMPMRPWNELIQLVERGPLEALRFDEAAAELGFACGLLIRRFNGWYAYESVGKDFLKERVLTFGANLAPRDVVRGVRTIRDVAHKFDRLRQHVELGQLAYYPKEECKQLYGDFARRYGVIMAELERHASRLDKSRDEFMNGFWAGYCLQGYDRPRTVKEDNKQLVTQTQE